ncbi:hypothetical protein [Streptomyces phaeoluteigriseus]|uniref:hypothetical protein n=1 Tax=Streptomyces phaeoluteigriseus TaxID=114686 RepID=UPI003691E522
MADDRSVLPGDGEPPTGAAGRSDGRWLNRETAERLLDGEAADNAVAPAHRAEADRLARTLGALAAMSAAAPVPDDEELPGEAAALAAFRKAHAERAADAQPGFASESAFPSGPAFSSGPVSPADDAGVVRIGGRTPSYRRRRPRWSRPARLGVAAALTVGMVGGVAVAAGTGVLPTPFDDAEPGPAASVSAAATPGPDRPLVSPPPSNTPDGGAKATPDPGAPGSADDLTAACREKGAGRTLDAERRRTLERAAGGSARVPAYCAGLLDDRGGEGSGGSGGGKGQGGKGDEPDDGRSTGRSGGKTSGTTGQDGKGQDTDKGDKSDKGDKGGKADKGAEAPGKPGGKDDKDGKGAESGKSSGGGNGGNGGKGANTH